MQSNSSGSLKRSASTDTKTALEAIVGDFGEVSIAYGGFVITVLDHISFPWYDVFNFLIGESLDVWIDKKDTHLMIVSKQKLD